MGFDPFTFATGGASGGLSLASQKDIRSDSGVSGGNIGITFGNSGGQGNVAGGGGCMLCSAVRAGLFVAAVVGAAWGIKKVMK